MDEKQKVIVKWLENEVKGKKWNIYFESYEYKNLTIYGAGDLGKYLIWALHNTDISVNCVIDHRADEKRKFESYDVYTLDEFLESSIETDAIVVTTPDAYEDVLTTVTRNRTDLPVMFLRDMIYEL